MDTQYIRPGPLNMLTIDAAQHAAIRWLTSPRGAASDPADNPQVLIERCSTSGLISVTDTVPFARLFAHARAFLYVLSLSQASDTGPALAGGLRAVGYEEGRHVLAGLDAMFAPKHLAGLGRVEMQVLFMMVLGTALAVSYADQVEESPEFPGDVMLPSSSAAAAGADGLRGGGGGRPTLWHVMRQHVWEMLSHYLIILGSRTGCRIPARHHEDLITSAADKWRRAGDVPWVQGPVPRGLAAGLV